MKKTKKEKVIINKYYSDVFFNYHYQIEDFVIRRRNIFNDKTVYRIYDYGDYVVIKEFNYFRDEKIVWLWIFKKNSNIYYVIENIPKKVRISKYLELINELKNNKKDEI